MHFPVDKRFSGITENLTLDKLKFPFESIYLFLEKTAVNSSTSFVSQDSRKQKQED